MQIKLFTIPINNVEDYNTDLNNFLQTHKIVELEKHLLQTGASHSWCFYISYIETDNNKSKYSNSRSRIDYMKILDNETFNKFSELRKIRKQIASEKSVSAYIVFTDAELAEIAKMPEMSETKLISIKGVGDKKVEKYGVELIKRYKQYETSREINSPDDLFK